MIFRLPWAVFLLAVVVGVLSAGRITRLITADSWPPVLWAKERWTVWTSKSERRQAWWLLFSCHWCFSPWVTLVVGAWAVVDVLLDGVLDWPWWVVNGWLAASYLVAMVVHRDEGPGED